MNGGNNMFNKFRKSVRQEAQIKRLQSALREARTEIDNLRDAIKECTKTVDLLREGLHSSGVRVTRPSIRRYED